MPDEFYAKSRTADGSKETVGSHLLKVAEAAAEFAKPIQAEDMARLAGILHDFGKYGTPFQKVLDGEASRIDHAGPGAALLNGGSPKYIPCIEVINGHHGGLVSRSAACGTLERIAKAQGPGQVANFDKQCSVPNEYGETLQTLLERLQKDIPDFKETYLIPVKNRLYSSGRDGDSTLVQMLMTRMLYSCLVDADYSCSAAVGDESYFARSSGGYLDAGRAEDALDVYMGEIREKSVATSDVDEVRNELYRDCTVAGDTKDWLMTVTAPTGAGKTLALLKLALRKCRTLGLSRIIVVLPFLSIADQTEKEYRNIIPDLIIDHSQSNLSEEQRELAARWDAPCIITTSVQFFESLFADKGPACRKLHNIANSVVIFDEAQTLPDDITEPTIEAILALCEKCRVSMILSTATQPAFECLNKQWKPAEVVKDIPSMYQRMTRVETEWRVDTETPLAQIAAELDESRQCCSITNLKTHALKIYREWGQERDDAFLLSTALCPAHRRKTLDEIRYRLEHGLPCKVSSTQCIEAGVSVDFPVVYRALAPLSSISQAAGRCNRHGRLNKSGQLGKFVVFIPCDTDEGERRTRVYPNAWYQNAAIISKGVLMSMKGALDINDPDAIHEYFCRLFASHEVNRDLDKAIRDKDYAEVAKSYRLIANGGAEVIVPFDDGKGTYDRIKSEFASNGEGIVSPKLLATAAGITVSTYARLEDIECVCEPIMVWNPRLREAIFSEKYIVRTGQESCYDVKTGLEILNEKPSSGSLLLS